MGHTRNKWKYHYDQVIGYKPDLDIRNTAHLPKGTGAKYLLCIRAADEGVLIAKRWCRKRPVVLAYGDVLVEFHGSRSK